ncbi:hypothetical protein HY388_00725 [Candidatus Daviesbacteria bacterium]|nr:hypothetical protein [Candidatus Daviesbacteria bacterium]
MLPEVNFFGITTGLIFHLTAHYLLAVSIAIFFWIATRRFWASVLVVLVGVFIDLDHLFDYFYAYGWSWSPGLFFKHAFTAVSGKAFLPLHGWDLVAILLVIGWKSKNIIVSAVAVGMFAHLMMDQYLVANHPFAYFLFYRLINNFSVDAFSMPGWPL